jgi:hypothetical protein
MSSFAQETSTTIDTKIQSGMILTKGMLVPKSMINLKDFFGGIL